MSISHFLSRVRVVFFITAFVVPTFGYAQSTEPGEISAARKKSESFKTRALEYNLIVPRSGLKGFLALDKSSALGEATNFAAADWDSVPEWSSEFALELGFNYVRDLRFIEDRNRNFLRRSSWLYPDDGCFARAELARENLIQLSEDLQVAKIFVFGDLEVATENAYDGLVRWWYHVAPIVKVDGNYYVIDPALSPLKRIEVKEWLALQSKKPDALQISICHGLAYDPESNCKAPSSSLKSALSAQLRYLRLEWGRQVGLGRDPYKVLGDEPPWRDSYF